MSAESANLAMTGKWKIILKRKEILTISCRKKQSTWPLLKQSVKNNSLILLHLCCAPCGSASLERLLLENREVTLFFSNSNIFPEEEYKKRLFYAEILAAEYGVKLIADDYRHDLWLDFIKGYENEPEKGARCGLCFKFSLMRAMEKAESLGIRDFTTTLSISPHKRSGQIFDAASGIPGFSPYDFKKKDGFRRSIELSEKLSLYRQDYCGCEFSLRAKKS